MTNEHAATQNEAVPAATLWASSAAGREAIDQAVQRSIETTRLLDEARKVDFEAIRRPLGMRI